MVEFCFLEKHPNFKFKFEDGNSIYFYFEEESISHGRIIVPKSYKFDFKWLYYIKRNNVFTLSHDLPDWFSKLVKLSSEKIYYRDRLRRLVNGKSNDYYKE